MKSEKDIQDLVRQLECLKEIVINQSNKIDILLGRMNDQCTAIEKINNKVNPERPKKDTLKGRVDFRVRKSVSKYITQ